MAVLGVSSWVADTLAEGNAAPSVDTSWAYGTSDGVYESVYATGTAKVSFDAATDLWAAQMKYVSLADRVFQFGDYDILLFKDSGGNVVCKVSVTTAETFRIYTRSGGTLTLRATSAAMSGFCPKSHRIDAHIIVGASGEFSLYYQGGTLLATWSGDTTDGGAYTEIVSVESIGRWGGSSDAYMGAYCTLVSDDDSRAYHAQQIIPNGAGALADFTGAYTAVDDVRTATPYTDIVSSDTVGHKFSAAAVDPLATYATGYDVVGVQVTNRARAGNGKPRIKPLIRHGGVDATGDTALLNGTDSAAKHLFTVNPSTGVAFTYAELASIEIGCEVAAPV